MTDFGNMSTELPEGWRPTEGSMLVGRIVSSTRGWSDQSQSYYPILVVNDESTGQDVSVHCFHAALQRRLAGLRPKNGERIAIKMGPKVAKKNNPAQTVQTYVAKIEGRDESVDWDDFKPQGAPVVAAEQGQEDLPF